MAEEAEATSVAVTPPPPTGNVNIYGTLSDAAGVEYVLSKCLAAVMLQNLQAWEERGPLGRGPQKADMKKKTDLLCSLDESMNVTVGPRPASPAERLGSAGASRRRNVPSRVKVRLLWDEAMASMRETCPTITAELRRCLENNGGAPWAHTGSPAKGGALMVFGANVMGKTLAEVEQDTLRAMLPQYHAHLTAHPTSLLPRFLFVATLSCQAGGLLLSQTYAVMNNVMCSPHRVPLLYDLKGSSHGRVAGTPLPAPLVEHPLLYQDNDVIGERLVVHPDTPALWAQLQRDSKFLMSHTVVDYSLLVGRRPLTPGEDTSESEASAVLDTAVRSPDGTHAYYLGIIDVLQPYNSKRVMENAMKGLVIENADGISIVPPDRYSARFLNAQASHVLDAADAEAFTSST